MHDAVEIYSQEGPKLKEIANALEFMSDDAKLNIVAYVRGVAAGERIRGKAIQKRQHIQHKAEDKGVA